MENHVNCIPTVSFRLKDIKCHPKIGSEGGRGNLALLLPYAMDPSSDLTIVSLFYPFRVQLLHFICVFSVYSLQIIKRGTSLWLPGFSHQGIFNVAQVTQLNLSVPPSFST